MFGWRLWPWKSKNKITNKLYEYYIQKIINTIKTHKLTGKEIAKWTKDHLLLLNIKNKNFIDLFLSELNGNSTPSN